MNHLQKECPLTESATTRANMQKWVDAQLKGEKVDTDLYGKPTEQQLRELENIRSLSRELQQNLHELETAVRNADVENQAMNPTAPMPDCGEDHEFVSANQLDDYYAEEDRADALEEERKKLTKGKAAKTDIQKFFKNQCVFVTGGTGFLGKVLIEKLMRSCGDVDTIYVLIRKKKGMDATARLHELLNEAVFQRAHEENPKAIHKVVPILGDMEKPGLGMSDEDRKLLVSKVSVIINMAATVRFDEVITIATNINVKGTKEMLNLAKECKNLKSFSHVSTAFANSHLDFIEEKFYDPPISSEALEAIAELDMETLEKMTPTLIGKYPNTYCFTKAIAESVVKKWGEGMPICVVRPSIVVSSYEEPVRGWSDSMYGPSGVLVGVGTGVIRTMYLSCDKVTDMVPVDLTVNAILTSAWHTAVNFKENQTSNIPIYNFTSGPRNPCTWRKFLEYNKKHGINKPTVKAVWYYGFTPTDNYFVFLLLNFFLHYIPALMIDMYCYFTGKRQVMLKLYNKVMKMSDILFVFMNREWKFNDDAVLRMWNSLSVQDKVVFPFNIADMDWEHHAETNLVGLRVYLVKDDLSTLPEARKKWNRLFYMHQTLKAITMLLGLYILHSIYKFFARIIFGL